MDVVSQKGRWLGTGLLNDHSKIRVRLLSRNTNDRFDEAFWRRRLQYALDYRKTVMGDDFSCARLIFGEADQFPGLTVDLFGDILVTEVLSLGMEVRKSLLYSLLAGSCLAWLRRAVGPSYERSSSPLADKEGWPRRKGSIPLPGLATDPGRPHHLGGKRNLLRCGLHQRPKDRVFSGPEIQPPAAAALAPGRRILDCCTHTGAFALNCAKAGAAHVTAVDISQDAVALTRRNVARNGPGGPR